MLICIRYTKADKFMVIDILRNNGAHQISTRGWDNIKLLQEAGADIITRSSIGSIDQSFFRALC